MSPNRTLKKRQFLFGFLLAFALLVNAAFAGGTEGKKVTKQFLDEISKMDANYMKKVSKDAKTGIYYDYNDPKHTESLVKRMNEKKAKSEGKPVMELAMPETKPDAKNNFGTSAESKKVENNSKPQKSSDPVIAEYENRISFEKSRMTSLKGEELKKSRDRIVALEKELDEYKRSNTKTSK
jgi:cell division protein FtsB